jgi:hypothetical protein
VLGIQEFPGSTLRLHETLMYFCYDHGCTLRAFGQGGKSFGRLVQKESDMQRSYLFAAAALAALACPGVLALAQDEAGKTGVEGVVVRVEADGNTAVEAEVGDLVEIDYSITAGIGGQPRDFAASVKDGKGVLSHHRNFVVRPARRLIGATTVAAIFKAEKPGKATVSLSVKGGNAPAKTYEVNVTERRPERQAD